MYYMAASPAVFAEHQFYTTNDTMAVHGFPPGLAGRRKAGPLRAFFQICVILSTLMASTIIAVAISTSGYTTAWAALSPTPSLEWRVDLLEMRVIALEIAVAGYLSSRTHGGCGHDQ